MRIRMNRQSMLQYLMSLSVAIRDDVRRGRYPECALSTADIKRFGPFSFHWKYDGLIAFREFQDPHAPLLGFWRYELGLRSYSIIFNWQDPSAEKMNPTGLRLKGRYANFDPAEFATLATSAGVRIAEWL
jgi:hypothetical protein